MHELALAEAVIAGALEVADKEGLRSISRIDVQVGELQRIEREAFDFAVKEVIPASEPRLASTAIHVAIEPARFQCLPCGRRFGLADTPGSRSEDEWEAVHFIPELAHAFLRCPDCGSPDFEVTRGRGVSIAAVEGEEG